MLSFPSAELARLTFAEYVRLEPRLMRLWQMCQRVAPPVRTYDDDDGDDDLDETDPADGWCAEDYFFQEVKPQLLRLVGWDRTDGPPELRTPDAYNAVYAVLFYHALHRPCGCCREDSY